MDLFEPVKDFFAPDDNTPAINPRLQANQKSFKTQQSNPQIQQLLARFPNVAPAYQNLQSKRVNQQGLAPVSTPNILRPLIAAGQSRAVTPEPQGNIAQNFATDATNLAQTVWKLPFALADELKQVSTIGEKMAQQKPAANPLEALGNMASLPGLRLIPGSYLASSLRPGGEGLVESAIQHPLYAALDVLPYASKAASASKTVKTAAELTRNAQTVAREAGLAPGVVSPKVNPLSTFIKNYHPGKGPVVNETGRTLSRIDPETGLKLDTPLTAPALERNALGRRLGEIKTDLSSTALGRPLAKAFSQESRVVSRLSNRAAADIIQGRPNQFPEGSPEAVAREVFKNTELRATESGLSAAERAQIGMAARTGDTSALSETARGILEAQRADAARLGAAKLAAGELGEVRYSHGPELYDVKTAERINLRRENAGNWVEFLDDHYKDVPEAHGLLEDLHGNYQTFDWPGIQRNITDLEKLQKFDSIPYAQARREFQKIVNSEARALPARWDTVVKNKLADTLTSKYGAQLDETQTAALSANLWSHILDEASLSKEIQSIKRTWQEIAANTPADQAPMFVHNVSPDKAARALSTPQFFDYAPSVSSLKERMFDSAGTVLDPEISLRHDALETLQRSVWADTMDTVIATYGRSQSDLERTYIEALGNKLDRNPLIDAKSTLSKEINRHYAPFDPDSFLNPSKSSAVLSGTNPSTIYLPNEIVATLNELKSQTRGQLARATDPLMKVFRTSVLTLSPRFYLNNVFGNGVITLLNADNPLTVARYTKDAWALAKDPDAIRNITLPKSGESITISRTGIKDLQPRLPELSGMQQAINSISHTDPAQVASFYQQSQAGKALAKFMDNAALDYARQGLGKAEDFGARFNSFTDDIASTTNFLEGLDRGLAKGLKRDEAIQAGIDHARRAFETWDTMTPTERSVIRSIFPFYGFTRNLLKFVAQYPATHPIRLGIMSSFAKAEEQDFGTGLPQQLSQYLYLSPMDTQGRVTAFAPGGINPFQDVGSYASMLGFLAGGNGDLSAITKNMNPLLSTALKQMGVDPTRGQADLYPDLYLDSNGQLSAKKGNPLSDLASAAVPQSRVLSSLLGINQEFSDTLRSNPESAGRSLLSSAGLPTYARTVDLPDVRIRGEISREKAAKDELKQALTSGDWDLANRWPSLRPMIEKLKKLSPEELDAYLLKPDEVSKLEAAKRGAIGTR